MQVKVDTPNIQGLSINKDQTSRLTKLWNHDQAHILAGRALDNGSLEARLIADEKDVRALLDDERVLVLERVAP